MCLFGFVLSRCGSTMYSIFTDLSTPADSYVKPLDGRACVACGEPGLEAYVKDFF